MNDPFNQWANQRPGIFLPVFFLSFFLGSAAQVPCDGAYGLARGNVCTIGTDGEYTLFNPALLAGHRSPVYSAGHSRPFAIRELGVSRLSSILPSGPGTFRLGITDYGISGYRELSVELAYGMQLAENLFAGISFRYYNTVITGDWNYLWTVGWGAGLRYDFSTTTRAGIVLLNPVTVGNHSGYGPLFPAMIAAGLSHVIYENTTLLVECSYRSSAPAQLNLGLEHVVSGWITMAIGFHSSPATYALGTGFQRDEFGVHLATAWSALPGLHPAIMFTWQPAR